MKTSAFCCAQHCIASLSLSLTLPLSPTLFQFSHPEAEETHKARPALCLTPGESCPVYEAGFVWVSSLYLSDFEFVMRF